MTPEKEKEIQELIDKLTPYTGTDNNNARLQYLDCLLEFAEWHRHYTEESGLFDAICKEITSQYEHYSTKYEIVEKIYNREIKYTTLVHKSEME